MDEIRRKIDALATRICLEAKPLMGTNLNPTDGDFHVLKLERHRSSDPEDNKKAKAMAAYFHAVKASEYVGWDDPKAMDYIEDALGVALNNLIAVTGVPLEDYLEGA